MSLNWQYLFFEYDTVCAFQMYIFSSDYWHSQHSVLSFTSPPSTISRPCRLGRVVFHQPCLVTMSLGSIAIHRHWRDAPTATRGMVSSVLLAAILVSLICLSVCLSSFSVSCSFDPMASSCMAGCSARTPCSQLEYIVFRMLNFQYCFCDYFVSVW